MLEFFVAVVALAFLVLPVVSLVVGLLTRARTKRLSEDLDALRRDMERLRQSIPKPDTEPRPATTDARRAEPASAVSPPPAPSPPLAAAAPPLVPTPPRLAPATPPPAPRRPPGPPKERFDWERFLGVKFFSWIAGIALAIAAGFFIHYSIQQGWLSTPVRLALGLLVGTGLIVACEAKVARAYAATANALDGAGVAILLATLWAGHARWHLLPMPLAFAGMALAAAVAVGLSARRDSPFIALLGLVGGFVTPLALPGAEGNVAGLFGYLLLLSVGLAWVAMRKGWSFLLAASLALTTLYEWRWVLRSLTDRTLGIGVIVFLAFPLANVALLLVARRRPPDDDASPSATAGREAFRKVAALSAALPAAFALFVTATPKYAEQHALVLGFLWIVVAGLVALALLVSAPELAALAALVSLAGWAAWLLAVPDPAAAWPEAAGLLAAFVATLAFAPALARKLGRPSGGLLSFAAITSALLVTALARFALLREAGPEPGLVLGAPIALLIVIGTAGALVGDGRPFMFGIVAVAICHLAWAASHPPSAALATMLPALAVTALVALGLPWAVARRRGAWRADAGDALACLSVLVLVPLVVASAPPTPWLGWNAALLVLGLAACVHAVDRARGAAMGSVLASAQLVLGAWTLAKPPAGRGLAAAALSLALGAIATGAWHLHSRVADARGRPASINVATAASAVLLLAPVVLAAHATRPEGPSLLATALLTVALVGCAAWLGRAATRGLPVAAVAFAALPPLAWCARMAEAPAEAPASGTPLAFAALAIHAAFVAWPLVLGRRAGRGLEVHAAAALSSLPSFLFARHGLLRAGHDEWLGLLAVVHAATLLALLLHVVRWEAGTPESARPSRRALLAGAALAFLTAAIPLQLDKEWITVGLALECAALAWLFARRIRHRGLFWWCLGLAIAVMVRLGLNPAVLEYHPRAAVPVLNWFLYAYGIGAVTLLLAARWLSEGRDDLPWRLPAARSVLRACAGAILFLLLNIEIADFWSEGQALTFHLSAGLAQDLSYTLGWAAFAIGLLVVGIARDNRPSRIASIALLLVVVLKAFLHDMLRLGGLYRVGAFVGLAVSLALVAVLFQRFVLRRAPASDSEPS